MNDILFWFGNGSIIIAIAGFFFCAGFIVSESLHVFWKFGYRQKIKQQLFYKWMRKRKI